MMIVKGYLELVSAFLEEESAATAIDYALLCAMIVIVGVTGFAAMGNAIDVMYIYISSNVVGVLVGP